MHRRSSLAIRQLPLRIGLLGGSFNPAHAGHLHLSKQALRRLGLQHIWWIISPQNPLKSGSEIAAYDLRLRTAKAVLQGHSGITICEIEQQKRLRYTIDTLRALKRRYPQHQFVWLMGADNLAQFHRWRQWRDIFRLMPIAVFDRKTGREQPLRSQAANCYVRSRLTQNLQGLAAHKAPCWAYVFMPKHPESATRLRNMLGKDEFLRHNGERITT